MGNQLDQIKKLYAKSKTYKIPKEPREGVEQIELELRPLSLEDLTELDIKDDMPLSELTKNLTIMVSKSLEVTKEEAGKISSEFMMDILEAIAELNNFNDEDVKKTGIKDFIKRKREQIKAKKEEEERNANTNRKA